MAKRKAARPAGRKTSGRGGATRGGSAARKVTGRKRGATRAAKRTGASGASTRARTGSGGSTGGRKRSASKRAAPKASRARSSAARKTAPRGSSAKKAAARRTRPAAGTRKPAATRTLPVRKAPNLDRPRRRVADDDLVPTPPSSLDMDRSASASRTGRRELHERYENHTETSPAITGGDVDADWESAYSVGDEAPGGDSPTPDQDIVDDIGRAVGIEYQDNEELKGADKVARRDKNRWELDPASSDDWDER